ncbi:MAG: site-specific DNA-methyltransferase, partial [bacterium]
MTGKGTTDSKRPIESYEHKDKQRVNNPPVGLVTPGTDPDAGAKKTYAYDPHLDPQLQWAGKAEHTSFEVPTVSLHVHERIDPLSIIEGVRKRTEQGYNNPSDLFFGIAPENPPLREAIEFYRHPHGWSNRLIAGDSLLVMNSLLEKEGMAGKVQMVYLDPPYGIKYGSNFQPFVNKRDVKDGKDEDLTSEPEQIRAFRDTWELGIHSYLTYLRDRLLLVRELLTESGSIFVQISDENVHHVRELMDEVFGVGNFCGLITFVKASAQTSFLLSSASDYIVWYCRDRKMAKYRQLYLSKEAGQTGASNYTNIESPDGFNWRRMSKEEQEDITAIPEGWKIFSLDNLMGTRPPNPTDLGPFEWNGKVYNVDRRKCWKTDESGLRRLGEAGRLMESGNGLYYKRYIDDFSVYPMTTNWGDTASSFMADKVYVVQTTAKVIQRCLLMTTDPGDLVLDITCGSGTTAYVAEQWGRRWITCDTSRVALTLARQRLMTAVFNYYELAHPQEGVGSGFIYKTVPHITLKSIANNEPPATETLYDQPLVDRKRHRVSGPFTVEAVPAPAVKSVDSVLGIVDREEEPSTMHYPLSADTSIARSGETLRQGEWRDELLRTGIRGKAGQYIRFARLEPLPGCRHLHADGETRPSAEGADRVREEGTAYMPQRIVVSFGPEHAPLEQRQVAQAIEEAQTLVPKPKLIVFAAFQFDPEAAKDIDETNWPGVTLLKAQMNADLLTDDLKKKRASNESFWLIGQPDVVVDSEEWIVDSNKEALAPYDIIAKLSRVDSLAKIN